MAHALKFKTITNKGKKKIDTILKCPVLNCEHPFNCQTLPNGQKALMTPEIFAELLVKGEEVTALYLLGTKSSEFNSLETKKRLTQTGLWDHIDENISVINDYIYDALCVIAHDKLGVRYIEVFDPEEAKQRHPPMMEFLKKIDANPSVTPPKPIGLQVHKIIWALYPSLHCYVQRVLCTIGNHYYYIKID